MTYKKQLMVHGTTCVVNGEIIITMNYAKKTVKGTNAGTHDDFEKTVLLHKVEGFIDGATWPWWSKTDLQSENSILEQSKKCEEQILEHMNKLANDKPIKTFADQIKELGFLN